MNKTKNKFIHTSGVPSIELKNKNQITNSCEIDQLCHYNNPCMDH